MAGKSLFRAQTPQSSPHLTVVAGGASRALMLDHYEQYLRTATNRNKRPFASDTINAYLRCARQLARWLDEVGIPGEPGVGRPQGIWRHGSRCSCCFQG